MRQGILVIVLLISIFSLALLGPFSQNPNYHNFADHRTFLGIPNFWDVLSNAAIFLAGLYGCRRVLGNQRVNYKELTLLLGMLLTGIGSAYYHWNPTNQTLVWDRIPMTLVFMPFFSLFLTNLVSKRSGTIAFFVLVPLGIFSVIYWYWTETIGQGDLRLYVWVQFFPILLLPLILWLWKAPKRLVFLIARMIGWYILAKLGEHYDKEIFRFLGFWSGHTLKHMLSAISLLEMIRLILIWKKPLPTGIHTPHNQVGRQ